MKNKKALIKTLKWAIPSYIGCLLGTLIIRYFFDRLQSMSLPAIIITTTITFVILSIPKYLKNIKDE